MAQDLVRGKRTIKLSKKGDTLTTMLISDRPLVAKYQNGAVIGSWALDNNNRIVYAQVLTSLSNSPLSTAQLNATEWLFNGNVIKEDDKRFQKTLYNIGSTQVPALKIKADIMDNIETTSSIEFRGNAYTGGFTTAISASINVSRENITANTYTAYIVDANGRGATITTQYPEVTLKAVLEKGGIEVTTGLTYQWHKATLDESLDLANDPIKDSRMLLPGKTNQTLVLTAKDVQSFDTYIVEIFEDGKLVKNAMLPVRDETDPTEMQYNVTGNEFDLQPGQQVIYKPSIVYRGTTNVVPGEFVFKYQKIKPDGSLVGTQTTGPTYAVKYSDIETLGLDEINILFEAEEK
ncbi:hypothetical protein [Myroides sp. LoEW2-1]|uniref:hypothetical protein n=1 Tax=Myroides sp. LoEW2-1 TaxID=2683192 RepID=UPI001327DB63|nr:hypothetical protein [Myroides sp. LoEW2-1]MVX36225.1 hypothetical protein [Myroides sp. LoEW2-1]